METSINARRGSKMPSTKSSRDSPTTTWENLRAAIRDASHVLAPPPRLTVSEWADANRRLSSESSAEPGAWRTDRAPYQRGIMDAVTDPDVREIWVQKSAQVGWTEILNNVIGYFVDQD